MILGALALVLAGVGVGAAIVHDDDDGEQVSSDLTTTTTIVLDTTTSTTLDPLSTTTSPPTTAARRTTTTRGTSTTVRPTTTTRPGSTLTTVAGRPLCAAEQIDISIAVATSYPAGQPVRMETTLRNKSSTPCYYRGYDVAMTFLDPGGRTLVGQAVHADAFEDAAFAPGQRITHDATWDPRVCPTPPCTQPPGTYEATAEWSFSGGRYGARQQFIVRAP